MVHTIRVWYVPYAYGIKYAYGTEQLHQKHNSCGIEAHLYGLPDKMMFDTYSVPSMDVVYLAKCVYA